VTLTVTVSPATATGTVTFYDGVGILGVVLISSSPCLNRPISARMAG